MRHGSRMTGAVTLLAAGVAPCSLGGFLVPPAGRPDRLSPANCPADSRAIALPPVTPGTDPDLLPTLPALEDPVALLDGGRTRSTWPWTNAAGEPYFLSALLQSFVTEIRVLKSRVSVFFHARAVLLPDRTAPKRATAPPPDPHQGERSTPPSPHPPPATTTASNDGLRRKQPSIAGFLAPLTANQNRQRPL